ncbi:Calponin-homology (CH) domain-containing protein [Caenorhabditis elegans]|uniref:Calponin-homology (CH) domain-containing protein n=2 Tax=Caenorhabditis elegans TaxID=6239 RepID=U4PB53_CAEEL|nr:Calponin-homology (CH) domain-containing protein [Caenorhabditis elegans]CDH93091.1 Calponin-homology (CH) domain-containing protein [Caenorhabditis elegans]|eukprot:NP_001294363.1 FiLamiN (actin binding protein) homolog [Caenorhabditis elegans]
MAQPKRLDQEEEVVPAIRHDDAEWKIIQQNTFTRWVKNHLQKAGETIESLETDFSDGLKLIALAQVLSHKNVGKFNKKVAFRSQKLENVSLALNFFQNEENIKIINIDSTHIVDHNKKLILGLVWTLILHYSISMGWIQEKREDGDNKEETPKQKLLNWIRNRLPVSGMPISNFTSDWNDGVALGALVNSMAPGALEDWENWSPNDALENTEKAMKSAQDLLKVAPLIAPAEMIHPEIDEMSVMTYLSQFPATKPIIMKPKVQATISNLDKILQVNDPREFDLKLSRDGFKPKVSIRDEDGQDIHLSLKKVEDKENAYKVKFTPTKIGFIHVDVAANDVHTFETQTIPEASVICQVVPIARLLDYNKTAKVGDDVKFAVVDAIEGPVEAIVVDPTGKEHRMVILDGTSPGEHSFEYKIPCIGLHSVNVFHKKLPLTGSPFPLRGKPKNSFKVWGRGIAPEGIRKNDVVGVHVESLDPEENIANANISLEVLKPSDGSHLPVSVGYNDESQSMDFEYSPKQAPDDLEVLVKVAGEVIESHKIHVAPESSSKIRAFGAGLEGGIVNEPCVFDVEMNGESKDLSFAVEGPSKAEIGCQERPDGSAILSYTPTVAGVYKVGVLADGKHIQDSPFVLRVTEPIEGLKPSATRVTGIDESKVYNVGEKIPFRVDTRLCGVDLVPKVEILDPELNPISYGAREITPGLFEYTLIPDAPIKHKIDVSVAGVSVPGAPFSVKVKEPTDASKLKIFGPGVDGPVYSKEPTRFTIDATQAGPGAVEVALRDDQGENVDLDVLDNQDGSFTVKYTAQRPGAYQLNVVFAGEEISPIEINVKPNVDVSGIRVEGLENENLLIGSHLRPTINIGKLEPKSKGLQLIDEVNGKRYNVPMKINPDGTYSTDTPLMEVGEHKLQLLFDEIPVKEAVVEVIKGTDVNKCKAYGPGLEQAVVGEKAVFELDLDGAGEGALSMEMRGPAKAESRIQDRGNGKCSVEYVAKAPGDYEMAIKFGKDEQKEHVKGSPFKAVVDYKKDPSQITISGLDQPNYRLNQPINFVIDTSKTKDLPVKATVPSDFAQLQPVVSRSPSNPRHHNVRFVPSGKPNVSIPIEIIYDGLKIDEKLVKVLPEVEPQLIKILHDKKKDSLTTTPITTNASHEGHVPFDVRDCGNVKKIESRVFGPDGKERLNHVRSTEQNGIYDVSFPTDMAGEYCVVFYINGQEVAARVPVMAEKIGRKEDVIKEEIVFHPEIAEHSPTVLTYNHPIDAKKKKAHPAIQVLAAKPDAVRLEHIQELVDNGHRVADRIVFTATKLGTNTLDVFYGGEHVDHVEYEAIGKLEYERIQAERAKVVVEKEDDVDKYEKQYKFQFNVRDLGYQPKDLEAIVMPPTQKKEVAEIIDNLDGTILVKYTPKVHGSHELSILQNGAQLQGTPIKFYVDAYGDGWATVYGPGLQNAVVGEPATFTVCAKGSQAKELSVSIEGPAKSQIKIHDNKDGTCSAAWVPPVPGEYKVHVKLGGKAVKDSPFRVLVMGEGQKRSHLSVGSTSEVALPITQQELKGISASIKSPGGIEEPCFVRLLDGGRLGVSFTPREAGEHLITVKRDGKLVPKAPFKIKVDKTQVGDASKVEVSGSGKAKGITLQANELLVDTSKAGYGGLSVSVQGPSKAELTCKEVKSGLIKVLYTPTEPGVYAIAIKFADHHVKDSPLTVQCTGKSAGRVIQTIQKDVEQHGICLPDQESHLFLKLLNTSPMDITARLMDPKGHTDDIEMRDLGQQYYQLKFTPKMEGIHTLSVMYKDAHVNGSPFQFTVGSFSEGGAHKVRAAGQGVVRGETGTFNAFNIYHREAGVGAVAVTIEGPSKATLEFKDHNDGNCHVDYKVATPGEYVVAVKFNDQHIPDSPFKVYIAPATGEVRKLELAQFHGQGIPAGKAFTFTVLTHRAKGHLEAKVVTPNNEVDTIDIVPIEDGESYAMRFVPKETGNHFIHVTLDGAPMRESPFRLRVGGKDLCDPTAISASGDGLVKGTTGQKCEFVINTANAGAGILTVQMDGPSKATLDAYELEKGYKVRYTPLAPGSYFASVKYNGIHAPGSPFKIPVEGKELGGNGYNETSHVKIDAVAKTSKGTVAVVPEYQGDAAKVTAKGAGLNKFFPGRPAAFQIDTGLAGTNLLMVGVVTTKGPCEEVVVRHQGSGHYVCSYRIPDRVKGFVFIKYGDKEIPGSPFAIEP